MKTLKDIGNIKGKKVLVRVDFNVSMSKNTVVDDYRIRMAVPTIDFLKEAGAKIILMSHLEREDKEKATLRPIAEHMNSKLGMKVLFIEDLAKANEMVCKLNEGEVALLENVRFSPGEKNNEESFAKQLASLGEIYVNDAFSVCHRKHASVVSVPKFLPGFAGFQLEKEITNLSKAFEAPKPFLFILGGAKFDTKLPLLSRFEKNADQIFIGGALAHDFFKLKGYEVGKSVVSEGNVDLSCFKDSKKIVLPVDVITDKGEEKNADSVKKDEMILDAGTKTLDNIRSMALGSKFILWNGPIGFYEKGNTKGTLDLAKIVAEATKNGAETVVGGGDTLAAIATLGIEKEFSFVSTGGGAMLDFLAEGTLPGIKALEHK